MGSSYLLDSNIIIYFLQGTIPEKRIQFLREIFDSQPQFSVITQIEVLGFKSLGEDAKVLDPLMEASVIFPLSPEVVEKTINMRKAHRIRLPDAIIAATAIEHDLILVTRNTKDFRNLADLKLENPFD